MFKISVLLIFLPSLSLTGQPKYDHRKIDAYALKTPMHLSGDIVQLTNYLVGISQSDFEKVKATYEFNPTEENGKQLGHSLIDYAGKLSDSAAVFTKSSQMDTLIQIQKKAIGLYRKAVRYIALHNWQKELYAEILINSVVPQYQIALSNENHSDTFWQELYDSLLEAKRILDTADESFYIDMATKKCLEYNAIGFHF